MATPRNVLLLLPALLALPGLPTSSAQVRTPDGASAVVAVAPAPRLPATTPSLASEIAAYLEPFVATGNLSGAVLVARGDQVLFERAYGDADRERQVANTPETTFHLASVSRVVTAIAAMRLMDMGRLSPRDPIARYLPDWPRGDEITVHHLLTLSAGFPNINQLPGYGQWQLEPQTPASLVARFRDLPLEFEPGARSVHSNSNYNVLALLIEQVSGMSFGEFLEREIFVPLGMTRSAHHDERAGHGPLPSRGYMPVGRGDLTPAIEIQWSVKTGNGSLYSTVGDLHRLDRALVNGRLLSDSAVAMLFREHFPSHTYGFFAGERFGDREVYINGGSPGFGSFWGRAERGDLTVIILGNIQNGVPNSAGRDLLALVRGHPTETPALRTGPADAAVLAQAVGAYQFTDHYLPNALIPIRAEEGHLFNNSDWLMPTRDNPRVFVHRRYWSTLEFREPGPDGYRTLQYDRFSGRRVRPEAQ